MVVFAVTDAEKQAPLAKESFTQVVVGQITTPAIRTRTSACDKIRPAT